MKTFRQGRYKIEDVKTPKATTSGFADLSRYGFSQGSIRIVSHVAAHDTPMGWTFDSLVYSAVASVLSILCGTEVRKVRKVRNSRQYYDYMSGCGPKYNCAAGVLVDEVRRECLEFLRSSAMNDDLLKVSEQSGSRSRRTIVSDVKNAME